MDKLTHQCAWQDVVQHALLLPDSSEVYRQALNLAKKETLLWFVCK